MSVKELDIHVLKLVMIVILHSIFSISSFLFIGAFSIGKDIPFLNFVVSVTVISFIFFNRCIAIDLYEYVRAGRDELPDVATDDLARNILKTFLGKKKTPKKHATLRLDILKNVQPLADTDDSELVLKFLSRKMHYVVINMIITVIFLVKLDKKWLIPALIPWLSYHFAP